jgi:hypothetical protein
MNIENNEIDIEIKKNNTLLPFKLIPIRHNKYIPTGNK